MLANHALDTVRGVSAGVTVVVACYNHARFVERALTSVFNQDYPGVSVIVTDDASTDHTRDIIDTVLNQNNWNCTRLYHDANRGLCATFNEALSLVTTPYVAFLSGDDWIRADRFGVQVSAIEDAGSGCALVYSDMELVDPKGDLLGRRYSETLPMGWHDGRHEDAFQSLLRDGNWIPAPSVLARTAALRAVGGYDESLPYEDYDMWLRLSRCYRIVGVDDPLVYYRTHPDQLTASLHADHHTVFLPARVKTFAKHLGVDDATDQWLDRRILELAVSAYRGGMPPREAALIFRFHSRHFRRPTAYGYFLLTKAGVNGLLLSRVARRLRSASRHSVG